MRFTLEAEHALGRLMNQDAPLEVRASYTHKTALTDSVVCYSFGDGSRLEINNRALVGKALITTGNALYALPYASTP